MTERNLISSRRNVSRDINFAWEAIVIFYINDHTMANIHIRGSYY